MSPKRKKEATSLRPFIAEVEASLRRFKAEYRKRGDVSSALIDLQINLDDLENAVELNDAVN